MIDVSVTSVGLKIRVDNLQDAKDLIEYMSRNGEYYFKVGDKLVKVKKPLAKDIKLDIWRGRKRTPPLKGGEEVREIKEALLTEEDIIFILQLYKPSLSRIFQRAVDLYVDEKGFIHATTPAGGMSLEPIVSTSLRVVGLEELKKPVAIVKIVEEWWKILTPQQKKRFFIAM